MADRVRRPAEHEEMLTGLRDRGVFKTYKDALVFAACLGFKRGRRVAFTKSSEPIDLQVFRGEFDETVLNGLAVAESGEPSAMKRDAEDERIRVFEEYACGGLEIMRHEVHAFGHEWEDSLIRLIMQEQGTQKILMDITGLSDL